MKKLISVCLALMLVLACIPLQASAEEGTPTFAVGTAEALPGETVEIPVMIENNPGIIGFLVTVSFDTTLLTLQNAVSESLFSEGAMTLGGSYETATYNILWENGTGSNATENGTFATLTFLVAADAPVGDIPVSISYSAKSTFDIDLNAVTFGTRAGAVTVAQAEEGGWSFTEGSGLYTYESEIVGTLFVAGLDPFSPIISDYVETTGGWTFDVELNEYDMESTGAKLVIYDADGTAVEEYWSVLFGDINGDGILDGTDLSMQAYLIQTKLDEPWANFATTDESPQSFAADCNQDFILDGTDYSFMVYQYQGREMIPQTMEEE